MILRLRPHYFTLEHCFPAERVTSFKCFVLECERWLEKLDCRRLIVEEKDLEPRQ